MAVTWYIGRNTKSLKVGIWISFCLRIENIGGCCWWCVVLFCLPDQSQPSGLNNQIKEIPTHPGCNWFFRIDDSLQWVTVKCHISCCNIVYWNSVKGNIISIFFSAKLAFPLVLIKCEKTYQTEESTPGKIKPSPSSSISHVHSKRFYFHLQRLWQFSVFSSVLCLMSSVG